MIVYGSYDLLLAEHTEIYAYTRTLENQRMLVILNFFDGEPEFEWPAGFDLNPDHLELLISNYTQSKDQDIRSFKLRPYEARVYLQQLV